MVLEVRASHPEDGPSPARLEAIPMKRVRRPRLSDVVAPDKLAAALSIVYN